MADVVAVRIAAAVLAVLEGLGQAAEVELCPPGDPASFPALHLYDNGETPGSQDPWRTRATLELAVVGYVAHTDGAALPAARNLDGAVIAALANSQFDGLAIQVRIGGLAIDPVDLAEVRTVAWRREISVDYSYQTANPAEVGG